MHLSGNLYLNAIIHCDVFFLFFLFWITDGFEILQGVMKQAGAATVNH